MGNRIIAILQFNLSQSRLGLGATRCLLQSKSPRIDIDTFGFSVSNPLANPLGMIKAVGLLSSSLLVFPIRVTPSQSFSSMLLATISLCSKLKALFYLVYEIFYK